MRPLRAKNQWRGVLSLLLVATAALGVGASGEPLPKDVKLPANVSVAIYLPAQIRRYHGRVETFESGRTLEDTVLSAGQVFFSESHMAEAGSDKAFGLLLALHPELSRESGQLVYTLQYAVFAAEDQPLLKGSQSVKVVVNPAAGDPVDHATFQATQQVMSAMITGLHPDAAKYPAALDLKSRSLDFAAKTDKPWANGTGFYFNAKGQILTAAHVVQDCIKVQVKRDAQVLPAKVVARSNVVDVAALDTGVPSPAFLKFRRDLNFELGEAVTNVGYPLQGVLASSPNLTRGNISARGGVTGSNGQLQFSAPIQPGSSGAALVSDGGEVLGITVGTLNAATLARQGAIPQNVNFALESRYVAKFMQKYDLAFTSVEPNAHGDAHTANQAALAAVVNVECYE
jgi:S1-C subfamily serine protease